MSKKLTYEELEQRVRDLEKAYASRKQTLYEFQADVFQEVLENSLDASYKRNLQTNTYDYLSPVFTRISGYTPEEMKAFPIDIILDLIHPKDLSEVNRIIAESMSGMAGTAYQLEYRFRHKKGEYVWLLDRFIIMEDVEGNIATRIGCVEDITDRKQLKMALQASEKKFKQISENTPAIVYQFKMSHDKSFSFPYVSERILGLMGVSAQEVMRDASNLINRVHPEDLEMFVEKVMISASNLTPYHEIFRCVKGETTVWVECRTTPTPMADGSILWDGFFLDITERKQVEKVLLESEERFNLAITGTGAGLWDWDMVNDTVYFSPQWKAMLGYEDHEIENAFSGWKKLWHPDDVTRIEEALKDYLDEKTTKYEIEHRLRHKDGDWRWILTRGDIIKGSDGKPSRWVGTNLDITARKQIEEKLIQSEALLKSSIESPKDMTMLSIDKEYRYLYFNQVHKDSMIAIYDSDIEIGMNLLECIPVEEDRANTKINYDKAFAGESHSIIQEYGESKRFLL